MQRMQTWKMEKALLSHHYQSASETEIKWSSYTGTPQLPMFLTTTQLAIGILVCMYVLLLLVPCALAAQRRLFKWEDLCRRKSQGTSVCTPMEGHYLDLLHISAGFKWYYFIDPWQTHIISVEEIKIMMFMGCGYKVTHIAPFWIGQ